MGLQEGYIYSLAFVVGVLNAGAWACYIQRVADKKRWQAGLFDGLLLTFQYSILQTWQALGNDYHLLAMWVVSNAVGTVITTGRGK